MLEIQEAQARLRAGLTPAAEKERIPLTEAAGRVLAEAVAAPLDHPPFDNSSMDGFAVRAAELSAAGPQTPVRLRVVGEAAAGGAAGPRVETGTAVRIMTGAPLPDGADAVVPVEATDAGGRGAADLPDEVGILQAVAAGAYVRRRGEDLAAGALALPVGRRLRPQDIGALAMLGQATVAVWRRPRVAVFSTGDELMPVAEKLGDGKIHDSNSLMLAALVESCGAEALRLAAASDDEAAIAARLEEARALGADLILSSAGVSVGAYDFVRPALERDGALDFWRVNMRPGKPLTFGHTRGTPFVGLPGNPVSAFVGFEVFLRPALHFLGGEPGWQRLAITARLGEDVESDGRATYLRGWLAEDGAQGYSVRLTGHQGSGNLFGLTQSNALVALPAGVKSKQVGEPVVVWPLTE